MSIGPPTFRLVDRLTGWDGIAEGLEGLDCPAGVTLARVAPGAIEPMSLSPWLTPARLAWGHARDRWYLAAPSGLLRWEPTERAFAAPGPEAAQIRGATSVAARKHRVVVGRLMADDVMIFARDGLDLIGRIPLTRPGPVVVRPDGGVWVCDRRTGIIRRYSPLGVPIGLVRQPLPTGRAERLAVAPDRSRWLLTSDPDTGHRLWTCAEEDAAFRPATLEEATRVMIRTRLAATGRGGFHLTVCHPDGGEAIAAFAWEGHPLGDRSLCPERPPVRAARGQLLLGPIDSGINRCRWHRIRVDADCPQGTRLTVAVATAESAVAVRPCPTGSGPPEWLDFTAGPPHPDDWQPSDALDMLVDQPPGRYLYLRLRFEGDGITTPAVRAVRLDFPRVTSLDHLPMAWRRDPIAEDFTERFLSLFDAGIEEADQVFDRSPALLDPRRAPPAVLEWLGRFVDLHFDPSWDEDRQRAVLASVPELYRRRGTLEGLRRALALTLSGTNGVLPAVEDRSASAPWGALGQTATLSGIRLFGRHRARLTLDASRLGRSALRSHGEPQHDARLAVAHRIQVAIPRQIADAMGLDHIRSAIQSQKPAHVQATLRVGHSHLIVGSASMVGIDTLLQTPPPPILGGPMGSVRLRRATVLRPPRHGRQAGLDLGHGALARVGARIDWLQEGDETHEPR